MRTFYAYTEQTMIELLNDREIIGDRIRVLHDVPPDEHFGVDMFNDNGDLLVHFEY